MYYTLAPHPAFHPRLALARPDLLALACAGGMHTARVGVQVRGQGLGFRFLRRGRAPEAREVRLPLWSWALEGSRVLGRGGSRGCDAGLRSGRGARFTLAPLLIGAPPSSADCSAGSPITAQRANCDLPRVPVQRTSASAGLAPSQGPPPWDERSAGARVSGSSPASVLRAAGAASPTGFSGGHQGRVGAAAAGPYALIPAALRPAAQSPAALSPAGPSGAPPGGAALSPAALSPADTSPTASNSAALNPAAPSGGSPGAWPTAPAASPGLYLPSPAGTERQGLGPGFRASTSSRQHSGSPASRGFRSPDWDSHGAASAGVPASPGPPPPPPPPPLESLGEPRGEAARMALQGGTGAAGSSGGVHPSAEGTDREPAPETPSPGSAALNPGEEDPPGARLRSSSSLVFRDGGGGGGGGGRAVAALRLCSHFDSERYLRDQLMSQAPGERALSLSPKPSDHTRRRRGAPCSE